MGHAGSAIAGDVHFAGTFPRTTSFVTTAFCARLATDAVLTTFFVDLCKSGAGLFPGQVPFAGLGPGHVLSALALPGEVAFAGLLVSDVAFALFVPGDVAFALGLVCHVVATGFEPTLVVFTNDFGSNHFGFLLAFGLPGGDFFAIGFDVVVASLATASQTDLSLSPFCPLEAKAGRSDGRNQENC